MSNHYSRQLRKLMRQQRIDRLKQQAEPMVKPVGYVALYLLILALWMALG